LVVKQGNGTPQGGVISPLLANLFLHYVLDKWLTQQFPTITFVRYADDVVVHCSSEAQAKYVLQSIKARLENCKLRLSETKTKITYCQDYRRASRKDYPKSFDFLGHTFKPMAKKSNRTSGVFLGFDAEISMKARTRIIAGWQEMNFHRNTTLNLQDIAKLINIKSRGIINYYGKINTWSLEKVFRHLELRLAKWVKNKFKSVKNSYQKANDWLRAIKAQYPTMFYHWQHF
jgi:hypothetical protein